MAYQPLLFSTKPILQEERLWYYLTHSWEDKEVHTFLKDICPKVNVIERVETELAYYDPSIHSFNHYTTRTPMKYGKYFMIVINRLEMNQMPILNNPKDLICRYTHKKNYYDVTQLNLWDMITQWGYLSAEERRILSIICQNFLCFIFTSLAQLKQRKQEEMENDSFFLLEGLNFGLR